MRAAPARVRPRRFGIDVHAAEREGEGNATYTRELTRALLRIPSPHAFTLFAEDAGHPVYPPLVATTGGRVVGLTRAGGPQGDGMTARGGGRARMPGAARGGGLARVLWTLGRAAARERVDALHVQYFAPLAARMPLVVTVHDLAFLHVPASFPRGLRLAMRVLVPWSVRRAARVVTVSDYTARDLVRRYGVGPDRLRVIPLGVRPELAAPPPDRVRDVLARHDLAPGYVLSLGRLNARKNLRRLVQAYAAARAGGGVDVPLVLAGRADHGAASLLADLRLDGARTVRWLGLVPEADLAALYAGAGCFVYPSLFEGFGLPVLEAMACGCPVISSDRTSLPEVVGKAGVLVDPEDVQALAAAIGRVLHDPALAATLREGGLARSRELTWERTARLTLAAYEEAAGGA